MKKKLVLIVIAMFMFIISIGGVVQISWADSYGDDAVIEDKIYCTATMEDDFADDSVIVVLSKKATLNFSTYTPEYFAEIDCEAVEDLTAFSTETIKDYYSKEKDVNRIKAKVEKEHLINVENFHRILSLKLKNKGKDKVLEAIKQLEKRSDIISADPNYLISASSVVNSTNHTEQNHTEQQWGLYDKKHGIHAPEAWELYSELNINTSTVLVGVLDTGIDGQHEALRDMINDNLHMDFTGFMGNGKKVDRKDLIDENGHGTHIAGIIAAQANNELGVKGVASKVKLVSLRIAVETYASLEACVKAIEYASNESIPILNYSRGGTVERPALKTEINNYSGLFVCSAGNDGNDNDIIPNYPSEYANSMDNVISVGAIDIEGNRGQDWHENKSSNYGSCSVSVFAPGDAILSTFPMRICEAGTDVCEDKTGHGTHVGNGYHFNEGTSMATPFVTGVAALIKSINRDLSPKEIKDAIINNVDKSDTLKDLCYAGGSLNAFKAVSSVVFTSSDNTLVKANYRMSKLTVFPTEINGKEITKIGPNAFRSTGIREIIISDTITEIGDEAFNSCSSLTNVELPSGLISIGNRAFDMCLSLANINLPGNLTSIGDYAFECCREIEQITIPNSVTSIGEGAFAYCSALREITLPNNLTRISDKAFWICNALESINIPDAVTIIGNNAFDSCYALKKVTFGTNSRLDTIGEEAFSNCEELNNITLPQSLLVIDARAFMSCTALTNISFAGNSYLQIIWEEAFKDTGLTSITIPQYVKFIGDRAFVGCRSLTNIIYNATYCSRFTEDSGVFSNMHDRPINLTIGDTARWIPEYLFYNVSSKITVKIEDSTEKLEIKKSAFENSGVVDFPLNSRIKSIGESAFAGCTNLNKFILIGNDRRKLEYIGDNAFMNSGLTEFAITQEVNYIGNNAFYGCNDLATIKYGSLSYDKASFNNGPFREIKSGQPIKFIIAGYITEIPANLFYKVYAKIHLVFENPTHDNIVYIHQDEFEHSGLYKITFPKDFAGIYSSSFRHCNKLEFVEFEQESALKTIGDDAFYGCTSLKSFEVPRSVERIGQRAFSNCTSLKSFEVPQSVTYIGDYAFYRCDALAEFVFEYGIDLKYIEAWTFAFSGICNIEIPQSVLEIRQAAFWGCEDLAIMVFAEQSQIEYIEEIAFYSSGLRRLDIPDSLIELGTDAFASSLLLETVTASPNAKLRTIDAFKSCSNLKSITIPDNVTVIEQNAFYGCEILSDVTISSNSNLTSIGAWAFYNTLISTITIPHSVAYIGDYAFRGCAQLRTIDYHAENCADFTEYSHVFNRIRNDSATKIKVVFCSGVNRIPAYFMSDAMFRLDVTFEGSNISIGDCAFCNVKFDNIDFQQSTVFVDEIGVGAFYDSNIGYFPSISVTKSNAVYIRDYAFYGTPIESINFNGGNVSINIGESAFDDCANLKAVNFNGNLIILDIGDFAFRRTSITSISLPSYILKVGYCAFASCFDLATITMKSEYSSTFSYIGAYAFVDTAITEFAWPIGISAIREGTFYGCYNLQVINFDIHRSNLTTIENYAFAYTAIENLKLVQTVNYIGLRVFEGCGNLDSVRIYGNNDWELSAYFDFSEPIILQYSKLMDYSDAARYLKEYEDYYWRRKV